MNTIISLTEARQNIFQIADLISKRSERFTLTEKGKGKVVMMSLEEFESWKETLDILKDFPKIASDIKKAEEEIKAGKVIKFSDAIK